jgi:adenine deaminase
MMAQHGVIVSVNSDDAEEARHLNQEAAKSVKFGGLNETEALKLVTLNPAIQLGIDNRVGSIEAGKDADLAIYNANPLSVYAVVQKTLIDGQVYFDREKDISARAAIEKERKDLLDKEKKAEEDAKNEAKREEDKAPKPDTDTKPPQVEIGATGDAQ